MNETNEPVVNIRYREEIKTRLAQSGSVLAFRIGVTILILATLLVIGWHFLRR